MLVLCNVTKTQKPPTQSTHCHRLRRASKCSYVLKPKIFDAKFLLKASPFMQKMSSPLRLSIASSRLSFASGQRVKPRLLRPYLVPGQIRLFNESTVEESPRTLPPRRNIPSFILTALVAFGGGMVFYSAFVFILLSTS